MKKGEKMMDMSIHDVSGVVGWCLGAYGEVENTYVRVLDWCMMSSEQEEEVCESY